MQVLKRDGTIEAFDSGKIEAAVRKAFESGGAGSKPSQELIHNIVKAVHDIKDPKSIDDIQDVVEKGLLNAGHYETAKSYILYRYKRDEGRDVRRLLSKLPPCEVPWGPLGYVTYKRTYSRLLNEDDTKQEEYRDTVHRVLRACQTQLQVGFTNEELKSAYQYMMSLKFSVAGRFLWQLGTSTVDRLGLASLQNCAFIKIDEPVRPFAWIFDMLMLGVGVGFNIQRHNVKKLPPVLDADIKVTRCDTKDADFIVPDSREGWVSLLKRVLSAFFYDGQSFTYSTILVRGAGSPIKGFGGIASGPEDLCVGIGQIQKILSGRRGQKLSTVDCLDIANIIASVVVAGNIRRSACIALGDCDDVEYLQAKRWDLGGIPNWRAMSNNSVVCDDVTSLSNEFWDCYKGNGEPYGLINLALARRIGRTKDGDKYPDPDVEGFNPCAEQSLANYETCCLSEIFLPNITNFDEAKAVATCAYRICKHSLLLMCHHKETETIVRRNMRMGLGITGYMQGTEEQRSWLSPLYEYLREYDRKYSKKIGVNPSIKLTTVKPSGTLSLLAGVTPGAHPGIYKHFLRRIRINANNPLVDICKSHGYPCEYQINFDGTEDRKTVVVSFPCMYPTHTVFAKDMSAIDQLEVIKKLQHEWSDNAVSVTIYYRLHELEDIKQWLKEKYAQNLKTVSFLLHQDHGFKQAPYEEITEEEYTTLKAKVRPITNGDMQLEEDYSLECASGACPIK